MEGTTITAVRVGGAGAPDLGVLPAGLEERVRFDAARRELSVEGALSGPDVRSLRDCCAGDPAWQVAVDALHEKLRVRTRMAASRYPSTKWGRLLVGLPSAGDGAWRVFLEEYRAPIGRTLGGVAGSWGLPREDEQALADEFFSWFFSEAKHGRLQRVGPDGKVRRFRGFVGLLVREFLAERVRRHGPAAVLLDEAREAVADLGASVGGAVAAEVDKAFCAHAVRKAMDAIQRAEYSAWHTLVMSCRGATLAEIGRSLSAVGAGGASTSSAHRTLERARGALRRQLGRIQLARECATAEAGEELFEASLASLAEALKAYVELVVLPREAGA